MKKYFYLLLIAVFAGALVACNPQEDNPDDDTVEALIKSIRITNAGLSGGDLVQGNVNNETFTVEFNIPAESNIQALTFDAKLSLGAKLDSTKLDFTYLNDPTSKQLIRTLKVINMTKEQEYQVVVNLADPVSAPIISKLVVRDNNGVENRAQVIDGILCLGVPDAEYAEIVEIALSPARATYAFTTMADGKVPAANPGFFTMDFMGLTTEYEVSFAAGPTPGADFSAAIVHDFTVVTGATPDYFTEEYTRGGDFDGENILIVNRAADNSANPFVLSVADVLADNVTNKKALKVDGVVGGTHAISAGRLTQGHIYCCNLSTGVADPEGSPLKVYHWANADATPELVLSWDGTIDGEPYYTGRLGDNLSISLDEGGNGYAYFAKQEADNKMFRFTVTGFTTFANPYEIELPAVANYYGMYNKVAEGQYLFTSAYVPMMWLFDADGNVLREFEWMETTNGADPSHACDPRIITFNRARYLFMNNAHRFAWYPAEAFYVFDITEGNDIVSAFVNLQTQQDEETLEPIYTYGMSTEEFTGTSVVSAACVALCNGAERDGKLLLWCAAPHVGMALIEVPKMK